MPPGVPPLDPDAQRILEETLAARLGPEEVEQEDPVIAEVRENLKFRLMGYALDDTPIDWRQDVREVTNIEKELVLDPQELKAEFRLMREVRPSLKSDADMHAFTLVHTRFGKYGAHVSRNTEDILYRVRREGWVIFAGLANEEGDFHTLGYNYGLHSMPEDDEELRVLSRSTLRVDDNIKQQLRPDNTAINWRSGIAESVGAAVLQDAGIPVPSDMPAVSIRRLGIASALKYILTSMAQKRKTEKILFNIGTLFDSTPGSEEFIRNSPSFFHNTRIFREDLGYRSYNSDIVIRGSLGEREKVAIVRWRPHWDKVSGAMGALQSEEGVIKSRNLDIGMLEERAKHFHGLLEKEAQSGSRLLF